MFPGMMILQNYRMHHDLAEGPKELPYYEFDVSLERLLAG
jgi:hypothetical protein